MRFCQSGVLCLSLLLLIVIFPKSARAETCFHTCMGNRHLSSKISDLAMRDAMQSCNRSCENEARKKLVSEGFGPVLKACIPKRISDEELKKIRSASASIMAFYNVLTWDVKNVLPHKIIRRVELATQNISLEDVIVTSAGYLGPGQTGTFYIGNVELGYPAVQLSTRIAAIYACDTH
ncbi:MAG: hypothetical protein ACREDL_12775 [Bradyrhizobium sp.]